MWATIGQLAVAYLTTRVGYSLLKGIYSSFLAASLGLGFNFEKQGEWAVVTGATDGIGKAYAFALAQRGLNLVLISRTPYKLHDVAAEINDKYGKETKIIDVDFTKVDIYERIEHDLKGLDIGILVNNVGMSYDYPKYFTEVDADLCTRIINCNIQSVNQMTKIVLPGMAERKRGLIINLSSMDAILPMAPYLAVYAATKAYIVSLSESLSVEYASKGVNFQCVVAGGVVSKTSGIRRPTLIHPTPDDFVRSTLKTTGIEKRTGGYFMHKAHIYCIELLQSHFPGFILTNIVYSYLNDMRIRGLKKKEREAKAQ